MGASMRFGPPLLASGFHFGNRGGGVLVESLPTGGTDGQSILTQWTTSADNGSEVMLRVTSMPAGLVAFWYEDGSLSASAADGTYTAYAQLYKDYVAVGAPQPIIFTFGSGESTIVLGWTEGMEQVMAGLQSTSGSTVGWIEQLDVFQVSAASNATLAVSMVESSEIFSMSLASLAPATVAISMLEHSETFRVALSNSVAVFSNVVDLEKALRQGVLDCALGLPVALENMLFTKPADGSAWAAVFIRRNQPYVATLGQGGQDMHDGFLQIDLNYPLDDGTANVMEKELVISRFFTAGRVMRYGATEVMVMSCGGPHSRPVDGYYRRSITIKWEAYIDR